MLAPSLHPKSPSHTCGTSTLHTATLWQAGVTDVVELAELKDMDVKKKSGLPLGEAKQLARAAKEEVIRRAEAEAARLAAEEQARPT